MKTLKIFTLVFSLFLLSSGVIAQTITTDVTITDNCGTAGSYTVYAWVYCTSNSTNYCASPPAVLCTSCTTGTNSGLTFSCSVPLDSSHKIYEVKVHVVKNGVSTCTGNGVSLAYTTDDLYGITIPVSVTLH